MKRSRPWLISVAAVVAVALFGAGVAAGGGASFVDVQPSHPFYDEIEEFAGSGVTGGYEDGTYRPGATVTRQAMAAFMTRGLGRVAQAAPFSGTNVPASPTTTNVATLNNIVVPGQAGGTQNLWIVGNLTWRIDGTKAAACNNATTQVCAFRVDVLVNGSVQRGSIGRIVGDRDGGTIAVQSLVNLPSGSSNTVQLRISPGINVVTGAMWIDDRQLTVMNAPFGF